VLFIEYLARIRDSKFGKKYKEIIENIYKKIILIRKDITNIYMGTNITNDISKEEQTPN
jgi:hypothetical protein